MLKQQDRPALAELPPLEKQVTTPRPTRALAPDIRTTTIVLSLAYFSHVMTFYFLMKWIPKVVVDLGHDAASAGGLLV